MRQANIDLRNMLKKSGVRMWQIADYLQISEASFTRLMRHELSEDEKERIMKAIRNIQAIDEFSGSKDCEATLKPIH